MAELLQRIGVVHVSFTELAEACGETVYMVSLAALLAGMLGLPLGIWLALLSPQHMLANRPFYNGLSLIINALRSTPFIILIITCMPLTQALVGTSLGVHAAVVPLVLGAAPFFARLVEGAICEVDRGAIDMGRALGASIWQIVWRILLPEARCQLIAAMTVTLVALIGYSAMAGVVGGGGLGDLAIRHGYQRFQTDVMIVTTALLIIFVQTMQFLGDQLTRYFKRT